MRIVSQDRMIDVPYNNVMLSVFRHPKTFYICCGFNGDARSEVFLGAYSTEDRCIEIMQEIREAAMGVMFINDSIPKKEFDELIEQMRNQPVQNIIMQENNIIVVGETYFYMPEE